MEREGQKEVSFVHLAPYTKCSDPSEVDVQKPTWKGEQMKKESRVQEGKRGEKQGRRKFTESWRVNQRRVKRKEPKFLTLSS